MKLAHRAILFVIKARVSETFIMENNDDLNNISIYKCKDGRMRVYLKDYQRVISYPKYIMEKYLGRNLKNNEQVHHKDGNPLNNDIDNLEVLTFEEHLNVHADENRKYYDKIMVCPWCENEFIWTAKFNRNVKRDKYKNRSCKPFCSKSCAGKYGREVQLNSNKS